MQETEYDLIIDIRSTFKTVLFSVFSLKSPYRIGRKKLYNYFIHNYRVDTLVDGDEISRALSILKPLEKDFEVKYDRNFRIYVSDEKKMIFRTKMKLYGIDFSKPVIVCAVATRIHNKMWEQEKMTALLARIIKNFDVQLIFNYGSFAEKKIAFQIKKAIGNNSQIFTDINAGNLGELAALIANSDFFLGNEGGPRHISQALDIPSFAIYPHGADKKFWLPNACERFQGIEAEDITEQTKDKNLSSKEKFAFVTVDEVWKRIKPMLDILFS
ncbi:MAG: lipopolysaccharide heptosyltransferase family protein [Dysgonamonadaceae bacterium]|nr:lipopolysaccharide heptosyltransferase family protein [Dysgonamonadaceae bacterium]